MQRLGLSLITCSNTPTAPSISNAPYRLGGGQGLIAPLSLGEVFLVHALDVGQLRLVIPAFKVPKCILQTSRAHSVQWYDRPSRSIERNNALTGTGPLRSPRRACAQG